jgi:hypothetical protein
MTPKELNAALDELRDAFPVLRRRLMASKRIVDEWQRSLRLLAPDLVSEGISRWLHAYNIDPTLEQFVDLLDKLAIERHARRSRAPVAFEQVAPVTENLVPVEEARALFQDLYDRFDANTLAMEEKRRAKAGQQGFPRRFYRNGVMGPIPGWNPALPMPGIPEISDGA